MALGVHPAEPHPEVARPVAGAQVHAKARQEGTPQVAEVRGFHVREVEPHGHLGGGRSRHGGRDHRGVYLQARKANVQVIRWRPHRLVLGLDGGSTELEIKRLQFLDLTVDALVAVGIAAHVQAGGLPHRRRRITRHPAARGYRLSVHVDDAGRGTVGDGDLVPDAGGPVDECSRRGARAAALRKKLQQIALRVQINGPEAVAAVGGVGSQFNQPRPGPGARAGTPVGAEPEPYRTPAAIDVHAPGLGVVVFQVGGTAVRDAQGRAAPTGETLQADRLSGQLPLFALPTGLIETPPPQPFGNQRVGIPGVRALPDLFRVRTAVFIAVPGGEIRFHRSGQPVAVSVFAEIRQAIAVGVQRQPGGGGGREDRHLVGVGVAGPALPELAGVPAPSFQPPPDHVPPVARCKAHLPTLLQAGPVPFACPTGLSPERLARQRSMSTPAPGAARRP
jgi:hypothetical protein